MMGQLTVEMVKADEHMAKMMRLALAGQTPRPKLPKKYITVIYINRPGRQIRFEVK
jgi:hypothetical protein